MPKNTKWSFSNVVGSAPQTISSHRSPLPPPRPIILLAFPPPIPTIKSAPRSLKTQFPNRLTKKVRPPKSVNSPTSAAAALQRNARSSTKPSTPQQNPPTFAPNPWGPPAIRDKSHHKKSTTPPQNSRDATHRRSHTPRLLHQNPQASTAKSTERTSLFLLFVPFRGYYIFCQRHEQPTLQSPLTASTSFL